MECANFGFGALMIREMMVSPCEKICAVDPVSGLCLGCGRNLSEIASWTALSDAERGRVMAELPRRMEAMRARGAKVGAET